MSKKLVIAVSSRALFDMREEHALFQEKGTEAFVQHQIENEDVVLPKGAGFNLVKKLQKLSNKDYEIEVVLVSKNNASTGMRILNSISHYQLGITKSAFTKGEPTTPFVVGFEACLFLSSDSKEVESALASGIAAATILESNRNDSEDMLRIAFDADAVLFDNGSEAIFAQEGLDAFIKNEIENTRVALSPGPFLKFLTALHDIQSQYPADQNPIRTAIVTARSNETGKRLIHSLRAVGITVDQSYYLAGSNKGKVLASFGADLFFDDMMRNCEDARVHVPTGHVPYIVKKSTI